MYSGEPMLNFSFSLRFLSLGRLLLFFDRESEVAQLGDSPMQQNILGFDIAMNDFVAFQNCQGFCYLHSESNH